MRPYNGTHLVRDVSLKFNKTILREWRSRDKSFFAIFLRTVEVAKRREGLKKQHGVLFFPERDRTAVRAPVPTVKYT